MIFGTDRKNKLVKGIVQILMSPSLRRICLAKDYRNGA